MSTKPSHPDKLTHAAGPSTLRRRVAVFAWKLLPLGLFLAATLALVAGVGVAQRLGWIRPPKGSRTGVATGDGTIYTCAMHPNIRQPTPGRCPICGMELVPAASAGADLDELAVKIEPAQRRLANIQTAQAEEAPLEDTIQTVGALAIDESRQATISAYVDGRLERLFADYTGVEINKDDHLAVIYSPQLFAAQVEYVESLRALGTAGGLPAVRQAPETLASNTRQRLREYGMTDSQLAELEASKRPQSRLTIYAPQGGTVVEKLAVEGNYVKAGDPVYRIAELSTVWLMLELFPEDATRIRFAQRVEAVVQSVPGERLPGRVAFIDPTVDPRTRTVGVRVELKNDGRLRPGDYAEAFITLPIGPRGKVYDTDLAGKWISPMHPQVISDKPGQCSICGMELVPTSRYGFADEPVPPPTSLYVPRSAVLLAGGNSVVYVETQPGLFKIRPVTVGPILRDKIVILEGLSAGESVATSGNFLIDSQMQLAGKPSLIDPTRAMARNEGQVVRPEDTGAATDVGGDTGKELESLLAAYVRVQEALASDATPPAEASQSLHESAARLADDAALPASVVPFVREAAVRSEHLHHMELAEARREFKPLSTAVISLAARVRSEEARTGFIQFHCPMVPEGGGDWIQPGEKALNPYFGSEMLHCGEKVRQLPAMAPNSGKPTTQPRLDREVRPC